MAGIDVFDQKPIYIDRMGTMQDPIKVNSVVSTGFASFGSKTIREGKAAGTSGVFASSRTRSLEMRRAQPGMEVVVEG
jgi:glucose dehydrogenase